MRPKMGRMPNPYSNPSPNHNSNSYINKVSLDTSEDGKDNTSWVHNASRDVATEREEREERVSQEQDMAIGVHTARSLTGSVTGSVAGSLTSSDEGAFSLIVTVTLTLIVGLGVTG